MPVVTEHAIFILASLAGGERHGYGIAKEVEELSDGAVHLTAGTLYGALTRLSADGLIAETREEVVGGRRRRYYELTSAGQAVLGEEVELLHSKAAALSARTRSLSPRKPRPA